MFTEEDLIQQGAAEYAQLSYSPRRVAFADVDQSWTLTDPMDDERRLAEARREVLLSSQHEQSSAEEAMRRIANEPREAGEADFSVQVPVENKVYMWQVSGYFVEVGDLSFCPLHSTATLSLLQSLTNL